MTGHGDKNLERARRGVLAVAALLAAGMALALFTSGTPASAKPKFLPGFAETYPEAAASPLNSCLLCHTSANPSDSSKRRNPYGDDWEERGDKEYRAIEGIDSDGDGFSNLDEIRALSFPGDPASTPLTVTTTTTVPGAAPDGAGLYASSCAACHGPDGGNLRNTSLSSAQFASIVTGGRGSAMPAFGSSLSSAQIDAIHAYVTGAPAPTTTTTTPGTPPDPAALFSGSCAGCHGPDGGNLVPTALGSSQLVAIITNGQGAGMPAFGSSLNATQIQALADYLIGLGSAPTTTAPAGTPPRSGSAVYTASCAGCHGANGGNLVGTSLSQSQLVAVITAGRGTMPGFSGRLPAAEIDAVATYLRSLAPATTTTAPGTVPDGANLYMQNCSVCHGPHGEGGSGGAISGSGLSRTEIHSIVSSGSGSMPAFGSKLSDGDLSALVSHVVLLAASGSDEDGSQALAADTTTSSSTSTSTSPAVEIADAAESIPTPIAIASADDPDDSGRSGSPWIPALPLVGVATWVGTDAYRNRRTG